MFGEDFPTLFKQPDVERRPDPMSEASTFFRTHLRSGVGLYRLVTGHASQWKTIKDHEQLIHGDNLPSGSSFYDQDFTNSNHRSKFYTM